MTKEDIERWVLHAFGTTKNAGFSALKSTAKGTCHIGKFSGNRLNSSTLRSQLLFCLSAADWAATDASVKKLFHEDQRIFVQVGNDVWDVYKGVGYEENAQPSLWKRINGIENFLSDLDSLELRCTERRRAILGALQEIRYGAPGTGKSFGLNGETGDAVVVRTTFHPDSDYSSFVGAYKPTMKGEGAVERIVYSFRPQAFMNAYVAAWREWAKGDDSKKVVLVIEEINRGNCAQIFGDLFQLLDRGEDGFSTYPIDADSDLAKWLSEEERFGATGLGLEKPTALAMRDADWTGVMRGAKLALPPNLYIWATMNTSDQSLFPIDSAFKRRWEWKYVPIAKPDKSGDSTWKERVIVADEKRYDWWDFISIVNGHIADVTKSEDKQLGYFFVKAPDATGEISAERFANKVLFYLYNDVFKDWDLPQKIFGRASGSGKYAFKDFFYSEKEIVNGKVRLPGEVRAEVVAEFIERQERDGKKVSDDSRNAPSGGGQIA